MTILVGGSAALFLGLLGLIFWWKEFFILLKGSIPLVLFLGGALAVYVGLDEIKDKMREEKERQAEELNKAKEELERTKAEAEKYKEELSKLKEPRQEA
jgi:cell shape-determining protein MreC